MKFIKEHWPEILLGIAIYALYDWVARPAIAYVVASVRGMTSTANA
jgi:hypothetical protein